MRYLLLASAAMLMAGTGRVLAQEAPPSQGQMISKYKAGPASNNNNNAWGIANTPSGSLAAGGNSRIYAPNTDALPQPGTIVIRLNGRVEADVNANFTSVNVGRNANGTPNGYKLNPLGVSSYMRLYPGFDGMAANGLRYGASVELRENFGTPTNSSNVAVSPSAFSSTQTVYVRRAFTYLATDQAGLMRLGQGDGVLGLFDNCIFTSQCWDAGVNIISGNGLEAEMPAAVGGIAYPWLDQSGAEYGNNKIVYLSPQLYGFDLGVQYAPNMGNSYAGGCNGAGPTCVALSSGGDPTRWLNQVGAGLRYQHPFGAVDFKAYGFYETAGKENLTTATYQTPSPAATSGRLRYDNLNFYKAGVAVTWMNVTAAADYIGGAVNGSLQMRPTGGVPTNAVLTGLTYKNGPVTLGAEVGLIDTQGDPRLTGVSQRREFEVAGGGNYALAPGLAVVAEYIYIQRHQGGYNFEQGTVGTTEDVHGQGFMVGTVLSW